MTVIMVQQYWRDVSAPPSFSLLPLFSTRFYTITATKLGIERPIDKHDSRTNGSTDIDIRSNRDQFKSMNCGCDKSNSEGGYPNSSTHTRRAARATRMTLSFFDVLRVDARAVTRCPSSWPTRTAMLGVKESSHTHVITCNACVIGL